MNHTVKNIAFWLVILLSGILLWKVVQAGGSGLREMEIPFSKFMVDVNHGDIQKVTISGTDVRGAYKKGGAGFHTIVPTNFPDMYKDLDDKGVEVNLKETSRNGWPTSLLNLSPIILFAALWFVMIRQMQFRSTRDLSSARPWHLATRAPPFSSIEQAGQSALGAVSTFVARKLGRRSSARPLQIPWWGGRLLSRRANRASRRLDAGARSTSEPCRITETFLGSELRRRRSLVPFTHVHLATINVMSSACS